MSAQLLRLFPLNTVLFPGAALNLHVFEPRYKQMISECLDGGEPFGVCLIREGKEAGDSAVDPYEVGTTAEIGDVMPLPLGRFYLSTVGKRRFRIKNVVSREPYLLCEVEYLEDEEPPDAVRGLSDELRAEFREYLRLLVAYSGARIEVELPVDAGPASFTIGNALQVADSIKQRLLEICNLEQRLRIELDFLRRLLPAIALVARAQEAPRGHGAQRSAGRNLPLEPGALLREVLQPELSVR